METIKIIEDVNNKFNGDFDLVNYRKWNQLLIIVNFFLLITLSFSYTGVAANSFNSISFDEIAYIPPGDATYMHCEKINDTLFAQSQENGLTTFDISDKEHPVLLDTTHGEHQGIYYDIHDDLYFLADGVYGVKIYNISDPIDIQIVGQFAVEAGGQITGICANETLLVVAEWHTSTQYSNIFFVNITDPTTPTKISTIVENFSYIRCIYIENEICYTANGFDGFILYNISNLASVTEIYHYNELYAPTYFRKIDDRIYVGDFNNFRILNISNLTSFNIIGEYYTPNDLWDVAVIGSIAFIGVSWIGLTALDISDPSNPQKIGQFDLLDIRSFDINGQYIYMALHSHGLKIISYNLTTTTSNLSIVVGIFEILLIYGIAILAVRVYSRFKKHF